MNIFLEKVNITKIQFDTSVLSDKAVELKIEIKHKAHVDKEKSRCLREMAAEINVDDKDSKPFIVMEVKGEFMLEGATEDIEEVGEKTGEKLFPYLQSYIATVTALAGLPTLLISEMNQ